VQPDAALLDRPKDEAGAANAAIADVLRIKEQTLLQRVLSNQGFWVAAIALALYGFMALYRPEQFGTFTNLSNMLRNFAPFAIMALGMTVVIITGGIDLSIGSIVGVVMIVAGLFLTWEYPWWLAMLMGLGMGLLCGALNGYLIAYVGMPSFVVTLGMLSIARSLAVAFSGNQQLYQFGPDKPILTAIGQSTMFGISIQFWVMVGFALWVGYLFMFTTWGRHLFAIGGNEQAARMTGVPVDRIKFQAYVFSALTASVSALLLLAYLGSANNGFGQSYELRVIAATVIGGASLMGGYGTAFGAVVGSALIELIRNALLMAGIDSNWHGTFVGAFIILAVLIGMQRGSRSFLGSVIAVLRGGPRG
jgi:ribose transport system permease protein